MKVPPDRKSAIFIKAYRTFLSAEGKMDIDQIVGLYKDMAPTLHKKASLKDIDIEAFIYSFLRLPQVMHEVNNIILAQTDDIFHREGYKIEFWTEVAAPARRRKMYYNNEGTLAIFINSVTDLDDVVCLLTSFQIEWNKMHAVLQSIKGKISEKQKDELQKTLGIDDANWERMERIFSDQMYEWFLAITNVSPRKFQVRLLRGSYVDYKKAAQRWFENIITHTRYKDISSRPLYFVSSNTHSLVNNITGWVIRLEKELIEYLNERRMERFLDYWREIEKGEHPGSRENFLWYILKKYEKENPKIREERQKFERELGIDFIEAKHYLDIDAQVLSLKDIMRRGLANKLNMKVAPFTKSDALILNIDYPLGAGAYMVLSTVLQNVNLVRGIYILGKASFLHGNIGDIALPDSVYDTFSDNTYIFKNAFTKRYFERFTSGSILTKQRIVTSKGTFLHSLDTIQQYFLHDYTILEMENGPYLNAIYEMVQYARYPIGQTIDLMSTPVDIGIIHYASDTPFTKAVTLGTRNLGYEGVESTYVSSYAILKRIFEYEQRFV